MKQVDITVRDSLRCIEYKGYFISEDYAKLLYKMITPKYISNYRDLLNVEGGFDMFYDDNPHLLDEINPLLLIYLVDYVFPKWFSKHKRYYKFEHTDEEWRAILAEYGSICVYCGNEGKMTKDHIIPIYDGGSDKIENIAPACMDCNRLKGRMSVADFRMKVSLEA